MSDFLCRVMVLTCSCLLVLAGTATAETTSRETVQEEAPVAAAQDRSSESGKGFTAGARNSRGQRAGGPPSGECLPEPLDPPANGCYTCKTVIDECGISEIRCASASATSGKTFCTITYGGGTIKCEVSGSSCTP